MSRATHDIECQNCHFQGKVPDDVITCPECRESVEGQAITGEALIALMAKIRAKSAMTEQTATLSKEIKA